MSDAVIDKSRYADAEEIATVLGKDKSSIQKMAKNKNFESIQEKKRGRHPKNWFLIAKLPKDIRDAVLLNRFNQEYCNEQPRQSSDTSISEIPVNIGHDGATNGRADGVGNSINALPVPVLDGSPRKAICNGPAMGNSASTGFDGKNAGYSLAPGSLVSGREGEQGVIASQDVGIIRVNQNDSDTGKRALVAANGKGASNGELVPGHCEGVSRTDNRQRLTDDSRHYILQFVNNYPGKMAEAVNYINECYVAGTLSLDMAHAVENCNDKINGTRKGILSLRSVERWKSNKKKNSHCIPKKTRVETQWHEVSWLTMFLACFRKPQKPHITEALTEFQKLWEEKGVTGKCPDYHAVRRVLKKVPPLVLEWGRSTGGTYRSLQTFKRRDWSNMSSNEVWVGDGHTFKAKVRHPEHGQPFAPEVTVIIDAASRFIVGWAFSLSENQIAVSEALGNGMIKHGKPLIYYSDNGSGQTAKTIDCPSGGMMARLGVDHQTGIPGNAQGRGLIEGLWDVTTIAVAKTYATYQGKAMDRDALKKITNQINSASRKGEVPAFVPDWHTFMSDVVARFEEYNTTHRHECLGGKTPAEVYFANFDSSWACPLTDDEKLNLYRPFRERTPSRGEVRFINNIYFAKELLELPANTKVRMTYDLNDKEQVWISDLSGRFICEAVLDGNKCDGFPQSYREKLMADRMLSGIKRDEEKIALRKQEQEALEYQSLVRPEILISPPPEPLKVVEHDFVNQEPEEKRMSYLETMMFLQGGKAVGNE